MTHQHTLGGSFQLEGKGLHTGRYIHLRALPAEEGHGIRICRTDLPGKPVLPALVKYATQSDRCTTLREGDFSVCTIEHMMAALAMMGVDNCLIELDGPEAPILDGSAKPYVDKIREVGLVEQQAEAKLFVVPRKIEVCDEESGARLILLPDDTFAVDVLISYDSPILSHQFASYEEGDDFAEEIAPARTFVFVREVQALVANNLIKGGDLDNALVIYDRELTQTELDKLSDELGVDHSDASKLGYISHRPLAYTNEAARHKLLDVLGDLALAGCKIQGRVIATKPGHTINGRLCRKLLEAIEGEDNQAPTYDPETKPLLDTQAIMKILPHRYPMLLVDRIMEMNGGKAVGLKNYSVSDPFFVGHFPQEPIVPGVLLVESIAQIAGILVLQIMDEPGPHSTYLARIESARFRQKVTPGDTVIFRVEALSPVRHGFARVRGVGYIGDQIVCEAEVVAKVVANQKGEGAK